MSEENTKASIAEEALQRGAQSAPADALVFFGATGDLAYKKIFPSLMAMVRRGRLSVPVIGVAKSGWGREQFLERAKSSITNNGDFDPDYFSRLVKLFHYVDGDYNDPATFARLKVELGAAKRPAHYLAIPPSMFPVVVKNLAGADCAKGARVVIEKPFGRDLQSARALNVTLHEVFDERSIFRIDHYLGKEAVLNLLFFRFANTLAEQVLALGVQSGAVEATPTQGRRRTPVTAKVHRKEPSPRA